MGHSFTGNASVRPFQTPASLEACPFIDEDDPACASHFKLSRLAKAFDDCLGGYRGCATYWQKARKNPASLITLTVHGRCLQPTGS